MKNEYCEYCGDELRPERSTMRFCSDKCRVYWNRRSKMAPKVNTVDSGAPKPKVVAIPDSEDMPVNDVKIDYSRLSYVGFLAEAKRGPKDLASFEAAVRAAGLSHNQRELVLRKLKERL